MTHQKLFAAFAFSLLTLGAGAQTAPPPQNVLQLSATGTVEVQQDLLMLNLTATRDGAEAAGVQNQLKVALDAALTEAQKAASPGQLDVRTGNFSLYPRYSRDGKVNGWQGVAELVLEGRDFARITGTAAKIQTMTMGGVAFGLSREQRAKVEGDAQAMAIERFQTKATELARAFGFAGYTLREVSVNSNDQGYPRPRVMAMELKSAQADAPAPVQAGKSSVVVTVSGSVQLR
ncbi:MAG: SIMPL domain-containing protein [Ramlibacter sp.]|nr:SIMPL domain-containing protein [Ramlibacter sp.]